MPATIDHLLWGAPDLAAAVADLERRTGVLAAPGGRHPDLGTHNALARLGRHMFLEVLAPDPGLKAGGLATHLASLPGPRLVMWAVAAPTADVTSRAAAAEFQAAVVPGHRRRPDGTFARWTNVFVSGHGAGTMVPFFIEWHDAPHPADDAPAGLRLASFALETPRPAPLRAVLRALDVKATVRRAEAERLVAVVDSPRGRVELVGP